MQKGERVTAEIVTNSKPKKITGTLVGESGGLCEIRPEGFETVTIDVPSRNVYASKPEEIIRPKLDYKKK